MKRVVAFGELLLSLSAPGNTRLVQAGEFIARYTGAEANSAVSLAQFGVEAFVVSKVPVGEIGQACVNMLRRFGVRTEHIVRGGDRLGLLFMEQGASLRPTRVIYDRVPSSFRQLRPDEVDWNAVLAGKHWFHFSGTAAAPGGSTLETLAAGVAVARDLGLTVSCDCNYRSKLWSKEESGRTLLALLERTDVLICGKDDPVQLFGIPEEAGGPDDPGRQERLAERTRERFRLQSVAMTFRDAPSASVNGYSALLCRSDGVVRSPRRTIPIVDRVGTGDAFAAGLIFGLLSDFPPQRAIDFAAAAASLKHSIPGDFNLVTRGEVEQLLAGGAAGTVQR